MTIQINTNSTAAAASLHLNRNSQALQKSLKRLASGSRILQPADDSGGLAVSMKLKSSVSRLSGAYNNVQNGISFLEVQDGVLSAAGRIMDRMIELKGMSQDMLKNEFDNATYNNEFQNCRCNSMICPSRHSMVSAYLLNLQTEEETVSFMPYQLTHPAGSIIQYQSSLVPMVLLVPR